MYGKFLRCAVMGAACALGATQAMAGACTAVAGNLVTNCGFETGNFSGWSVQADGTYVVTPGFDGFPANSGNYFAALGSDSNTAPFGTLSQAIADSVRWPSWFYCRLTQS